MKEIRYNNINPLLKLSFGTFRHVISKKVEYSDFPHISKSISYCLHLQERKKFLFIPYWINITTKTDISSEEVIKEISKRKLSVYLNKSISEEEVNGFQQMLSEIDLEYGFKVWGTKTITKIEHSDLSNKRLSEVLNQQINNIKLNKNQ